MGTDGSPDCSGGAPGADGRALRFLTHATDTGMRRGMDYPKPARVYWSPDEGIPDHQGVRVRQVVVGGLSLQN